MLDDPDKVKHAFEHALNRHGYSFQYSVIQKLMQLFDDHISPCSFECAEFPVAVQGRDTRIDFILRAGAFEFGRYHYQPTPFYIVAECKRANPALSNWCFARAPHVRRSQQRHTFIVEQLSHELVGDTPEYRSSGAALSTSSDELYHIGFEVRSAHEGDNKGDSRGAIENAATQVCRGLNGLVEYLRHAPSCIRQDGDPCAVIMPVIFTTARLFTTNVDLSSADIANGNLSLSTSQLQSRKWLAFQYNLSVGLKHTLDPQERSLELFRALTAEYARSIPIISPTGIEDFFSTFDFNLRQLQPTT